MLPILVTEETNQTTTNFFRKVLDQEEIEYYENFGQFIISGKKYLVSVYNWFLIDPNYIHKRKLSVLELKKIVHDLNFVFQVDLNTKETFLWKITSEGAELVLSLQEFLNPS